MTEHKHDRHDHDHPHYEMYEDQREGVTGSLMAAKALIADVFRRNPMLNTQEKEDEVQTLEAIINEAVRDAMVLRYGSLDEMPTITVAFALVVVTGKFWEGITSATFDHEVLP